MSASSEGRKDSGTFPRVVFELSKQPTDTSCGPTCLHGVYRFYGDEMPLEQVIAEVPALEEGGTLAVNLGTHALKRGYNARLCTFNLAVFDPTWFEDGKFCRLDRLKASLEFRRGRKLRQAIKAYIDFVERGGRIQMVDLNASLLRKFLKRKQPILSGLSSTYLYQTSREIPSNCQDDDLMGEPAGHFVVVSGYDSDEKRAEVVDPFVDNPLGDAQRYMVSLDRLITAILLGVLTYDANLLVIEKRGTASH